MKGVWFYYERNGQVFEKKAEQLDDEVLDYAFSHVYADGVALVGVDVHALKKLGVFKRSAVLPLLAKKELLSLSKRFFLAAHTLSLKFFDDVVNAGRVVFAVNTPQWVVVKKAQFVEPVRFGATLLSIAYSIGNWWLKHGQCENAVKIREHDAKQRLFPEPKLLAKAYPELKVRRR